MAKKIKRIRAYADIGSHNGIFEFCAGPVAERYPKLMHVYSKKSPGLKPVIIEYKID